MPVCAVGGVPQGSVLGPILFLTYLNLNDIIDNLQCDCYLFADDMGLFNEINGKQGS